VVIAIIGILIALLLPAVQAAREAARRSQCSNNLKQVGLALHNYADSYGSFPPAFVWSSGGSATGNGNNYTQWGWGALILPYMEQQAIDDALDVGGTHLAHAVTVTAMYDTMREPIDTYKCPSDTAPDVTANIRRLNDTGGFDSGQYRTAVGNYVGSHGTWSTRYGPRQGQFFGNNKRDEVGAFQDNKGVKFAEIRDGTSNTIAVGERRWDYVATNGAIRFARAALIYGVQRPNNGSDRADQIAVGRPRPNFDTPVQWRARQGFSSQHPGGTMFVFCDGSTHFVSETIEWGPDDNGDQWATGPGSRATNTTYERLIARSDGQPVGDY
jgi:type II secretory pathway pseudopilin PulG